MKRLLTYVGQQVYEWAFSAPAQFAMTALAKVCQSIFGTVTTVNGLACTATSPASMSVVIGPGEIYQMAALEATVAGTLPADAAHQILKQGIQLDNYTTPAFATPGTSGQSIAYLIQAQYADQDISIDPTTGTTPVVLQYYNADTPSVPWSGPNDSGSTSNTFRDGVVSLSIKAGAAAATGSQVTPAPDSGYVGLSVVTVAYGQTTITAANIAAYPSAPRLSDSLLNQIAARALLNGSPSNRFSAADAVAATDVVNLEVAQAMRWQSQGYVTFADVSIPLTAAATSGWFVGYYGPAGASTLPATSGYADDTLIWLRNLPASGGGTWTLNRSGADVFEGLGTSVGNTSVALEPGDDVILLVKPALGRFSAIGGSALLKYRAVSVGAATAAAHAAQLQQVQGMRGQLRGVFGFSSSQTLTATHAGGYILFYGSTVSQTITLPAWSSISANDEFHFYNGASVPVTIAPPSGATGITPKIVQPGESYDVAADAVANGFVTEGGTTTLQSIATMPAPFGPTSALSGYCVAGATSISLTDRAVHVSSDGVLPGHRISNFSATLDLTKSGVLNGMIGGAPAAGQFIAVYAVFNPATGASGVLGFSVSPTASAPSYPNVITAPPITGYTESCLLTVLLCSSTTAGVLADNLVHGKLVTTSQQTILSVTTGVTARTAMDISGAVPSIAIAAQVVANAAESTPGQPVSITVSAATSGLGAFSSIAGVSNQTSNNEVQKLLHIATPQRLYYNMTNTNAGGYIVAIEGYQLP